MNIEKIILGELKKYPYIRSGFDKPALEDIALSIAIKIEDEFVSREDVPEIKTLDREEVKKIISNYSADVEYEKSYATAKDKIGLMDNCIDKICELIIPEKRFDRDKVEEIIVNYKDYLLTFMGFKLGTHKDESKIFWEEYYKAIDQIMQLIPEQGEEMVQLKRHIDMQNLTIAGLKEQLEGIPKTTPYSNTVETEQGEVIAEGIFNYDNKDIPLWLDNTQVNFKRYKGKNIQIIIKVVKK